MGDRRKREEKEIISEKGEGEKRKMGEKGGKLGKWERL